jgi:hypothetical protein
MDSGPRRFGGSAGMTGDIYTAAEGRDSLPISPDLLGF